MAQATAFRQLRPASSFHNNFFRPMRWRPSAVVLSCLLAYTTLSAFRNLLAGGTDAATDTAPFSSVSRASRALRETAAAAAAAGAALRPSLKGGPPESRDSAVTTTTIGSSSSSDKSRASGAFPQELDPAQFKRCRAAKEGVVVPRLSPVKRWRGGGSSARRRESVTLVTQLSLERLEMLENQCRVWSDVIAAVVYVPTLDQRIASAQDPSLHGAGMEEGVGRLEAFHQRMQAEALCTLDLELVTEDFQEGDEGVGLYPFNAARNRALMLAQTPALLLLDADFVPSPTIVQEYSTPQGYAELMGQLERGQAIVLPAFETAVGGAEGQRLALEAVQSGKAFAVAAYQAGSLAGFQVKKYPAGHSPTNYQLWEVQDLPYVVQYKKGYEPYVLVSSRWVPWYDERFRGYGRDKIQHLTHLAGLNITFSVHPTAFVVHVPHPKAATFKATKASGQWDKLYKLYMEVQKDVRHHRFVPVVSFKQEHPQLCSTPGQAQQEGQQAQEEGQGAIDTDVVTLQRGEGEGGGRQW